MVLVDGLEPSTSSLPWKSHDIYTDISKYMQISINIDIICYFDK